MEFEKEIEVISKLGTLSDKLKYYNDNVSFLIGIGNFQHQVGFGVGREQHNIFCLCEQCEGKYSISDFETYRDIRNQETQKVVDFFESTNDYKTKIEYYFKISQGFSTTTRTLFFVPDILDEINIHKFPYKISTIDITPKDTNEITILKNHLKQKLLTDESRVWISMAQFTFEKRVGNIEKYLKIRIEKNRREELIQLEYDKISLSKVDRSSKKPYDTTLFKILKVAEDIIQEKHNEFYTEFRKIEITILAEDTIKYEQYLNGLSIAKPDNSHLKYPESEIPIVPKDITIFEKIKRELNIIHWAFKSQFEKRSTEMIYPMLHQDGRYCSSIYIRSDDALLNIEKYKIYYTERFESTPNISLVKNELIQIYEKALFLRDFFNNNLIDNCEIVVDYLEKKKEQMYSTEFSIFHTMIICVENYHPMGVLFGLSGEIKNHETAWTDKKYNYYNDNHQLAIICQKLVDFVEAFDIIEKVTQQKELTNKEKNRIIPNQNFDDKSKKIPISDELEQIDSNLWQWLQNYESTNEYISIPTAIEERKDYVIDTYKNYEERNFKFQLEICNIILEKVPNEQIILKYKKEYEKKIIDLRKEIPLPNVNIEKLISDINNAFYRLEKFMKGSSLEYKTFLFNDAFTLFFNELDKLENVNYQNDTICIGYYKLINQICFDYDKSEFNNTDAYDNDDFNRDCNEIEYLACDRYEEFNFPEDEQQIKISITDLIKPITNTPKVINIDFEDTLSINDEINPYPKIFKDYKAFTIFKNLLDEFSDTKENLSNYSFVFHKMTYEDLIHFDLKQQSYFDFLDGFDINISRIKPLGDIGKIALRESIYAKAK
jgi:hypothetical protein